MKQLLIVCPYFHICTYAISNPDECYLFIEEHYRSCKLYLQIQHEQNELIRKIQKAGGLNAYKNQKE